MDLHSLVGETLDFLREVESTLDWLRDEIADGFPIDPTITASEAATASRQIAPSPLSASSPLHPLSPQENNTILSQIRAFQNDFAARPAPAASLAHRSAVPPLSAAPVSPSLSPQDPAFAFPPWSAPPPNAASPSFHAAPPAFSSPSHSPSPSSSPSALEPPASSFAPQASPFAALSSSDRNLGTSAFPASPTSSLAPIGEDVSAVLHDLLQGTDDLPSHLAENSAPDFQTRPSSASGLKHFPRGQTEAKTLGRWEPDRSTLSSSNERRSSAMSGSFYTPHKRSSSHPLPSASYTAPTSQRPEAAPLSMPHLQRFFAPPSPTSERLDLPPLSISLLPPLAGSEIAEADAKLHHLNRAFSPCPLCGSSPCRHWLFGSGPVRSRLLILTDQDTPHEAESKNKYLLPSSEATLLSQMFASIGMKLDEAYITHLSKCRLPKVKRSKDIEAHFLDLLFAQISILQPDLILLLGSIPCRHLLPASIAPQERRGQWFSLGKDTLFATFSPNYLLRNPSDKPKAWLDLQQIAAWFLLRPSSPTA